VLIVQEALFGDSMEGLVKEGTKNSRNGRKVWEAFNVFGLTLVERGECSDTSLEEKKISWDHPRSDHPFSMNP